MKNYMEQLFRHFSPQKYKQGIILVKIKPGVQRNGFPGMVYINKIKNILRFSYTFLPSTEICCNIALNSKKKQKYVIWLISLELV